VTDGADAPAEIRTFLIADVRGYTRFTQTHGDEAGARLAARFAEVVQEQIEARGGRVVELRGDEALCVFTAPRAALRAAVDLQRRCAQELRADPTLPLAIGIGIDAGEAIPVAGGYRGGALNLAARLCAAAGRGEVLVSDGVVHLARRTDEITYIDRGLRSFKGFDEPVHVLQLDLNLDLPDEESAAVTTWTPIRVASIAVAAVALVALLVVVAATSLKGPHHPGTLGTNVVGMLDSSGHILAEVPLGGSPAGIAAGAGSVWATVRDRGRIVRIDPRAHIVIDTIPLHARAPTGIAVGGGDVWVTDGGGGSVFWVNPDDTGAVQRIRVGQGPGPIAFGAGAAWVINTVDATLQRVDASSFKASSPVAVGGSPSAVAFGGGWVWVTDSGSSTVVKVDPKTLRIVGRSRIGNNPVAIAYGGGKLWVANADDGTVTRLDGTTQQQQLIPVGRRPSGLSYADGIIWVTTAAGVTRIDPSLHVSSTSTRGVPVAAVQAGGRVWVAALASPSSHRGGILRVAHATKDFEPGFGPFDPAVAPYQSHWQMLSMISDGLVTYRKAGGSAGLQVVPDLAVAMPTITDGGRTYDFQLRTGIRYSSGRRVRASDFRYSIERALSPAALSVASRGYYQGIVFSNIVGYDACRAHPKTCSLAAGIQTDDANGTITVHLTRADPAMPQKLAMTFAAFVPPGSPPPNSQKPVAGTGPYKISRLVDHGAKGVIAVRNPYFREWSADAQPAGYPDEIRWVRYRDPAAELSAVEKGTADVIVDQPPPERFAQLSTKYATLAHTVGGLSTQLLSLNTRVPPFDRLAARQAVNFALDRAAMARAMGGASAFEPTCQVLPPGMFGYAPYCPYTAGSKLSGSWTAPDLRRARGLVRRSGTRGAKVVVWAWGGSDSTVLVPLIVRTLDELGYRASSHITPANSDGFGEWNDASANSKKRVSAVLTGWSADYPNPIDFLDLLLSCRSFVPGNVGNLNTAEFCDPRLDSLIHRAEAIQVRDPAGGAALWQAADREVVDKAAWAPLLNNVATDVVSARVGNYAHNPEYSVLLNQLWVR
jgi:ABC-type transport system substrate-binding protein/class 3 adenylate cyclase/DNA-binding beta-propeller fold protein YncE